MKTVTQKIIALTMGAILVLSSSLLSVGYADNSSVELSLDSYIGEAMSNYIMASGLDINSNYLITTEIPIYSQENTVESGYSVYLIDNADDTVVGEMNIYRNNIGYYSDFSLMENTSISSSLLINENVYIKIDDSGKWLYSEGNASVPLIDNCDENSVITLATYSNDSKYSYVTAKEFRFDNDSNIALLADTGNAIGSVKYNVSHVSNTIVAGRGICWAASIAMKVNYVNKSNYSALNIYNIVKNRIWASVRPSGNAETEPSGTIGAVVGAYDYFGISVTGTSTASEFPTNQGVWDSLTDNSAPLDIAIRGEDASSTLHYHQVLIIGMAVATKGLTYTFYCPNSTEKHYVYIMGTPATTLNQTFRSFEYTDSWTHGTAEEELIHYTHAYIIYY